MLQRAADLAPAARKDATLEGWEGDGPAGFWSRGSWTCDAGDIEDKIIPPLLFTVHSQLKHQSIYYVGRSMGWGWEFIRNSSVIIESIIKLTIDTYQSSSQREIQLTESCKSDDGHCQRTHIAKNF